MAGHIYVLINELSVERQFTPANVADGLLLFFRSCNRVKSIGKKNYSIMYQGSIYYKEIANGLNYAAALKTLTGKYKDEILYLKMNMDRSGWEKLEDIGFFQDANANYSVGTGDVSNSSLAEAYEYKSLVTGEDDVIVVNVPSSSYGSLINIKKNPDNLIQSVNAINSEQEAITYLQRKGFPMQYDRNSTMRPLPEQTILGDTSLFTKTQRTNMGAYLYERIGHNELWCLDTLHRDGSAHFEIFSMANDTWKGENKDLQSINPNYHSKKHKGSKIKE